MQRERLLSGHDTPYGYGSSKGVEVTVRMASCRICGPKLSSCCLVISVWGALMLVLMGAFFRIESVALIEDVARDATTKHPDWIGTSNNCFIAAGLYVVFFALSWYQRSAITGGKRYC